MNALTLNCNELNMCMLNFSTTYIFLSFFWHKLSQVGDVGTEISFSALQ